jgi:hypothetical protein
MMMNRHEVITIAREQVGRTETPVNKTIYGKWYGLDGQPWCAMFVSWVFMKAGATSLINQSPKGFAGCESFEAWAKKNKMTVPVKQVEPGDILLFDFNKEGKSIHTGIALGYNVHTHLIDTIEGNTSGNSTGSQANGDGVFIKHRAPSTVRCVVRPKWVA